MSLTASPKRKYEIEEKKITKFKDYQNACLILRREGLSFN